LRIKVRSFPVVPHLGSSGRTLRTAGRAGPLQHTPDISGAGPVGCRLAVA